MVRWVAVVGAGCVRQFGVVDYGGWVDFVVVHLLVVLRCLVVRKKHFAAPGRAHVRGLPHVSRPGPGPGPGSAGSGERKSTVLISGGFASVAHLCILPFSETYD